MSEKEPQDEKESPPASRAQKKSPKTPEPQLEMSSEDSEAINGSEAINTEQDSESKEAARSTPKSKSKREQGKGANKPAQPKKRIRSLNTNYLDPHHPIQELLIPVHGMVYLTPSEIKIINHPAFQRLFNVYQLGQTYLVYRGATHRRGEHSLGSLGALQLLIERLKEPSDGQSDRISDIIQSKRAGQWLLGPGLSRNEQIFARLAVLLHDLGHVAAGHTLEDELGLLRAHDSRERFLTILEKESWGGKDVGDHRFVEKTLENLIDDVYGDIATAAVREEHRDEVKASTVLLDIIAKRPSDSDGSSSKSLSSDVDYLEPDFRIHLLRDIVGNTVCADLLDYIHRDWLYIGKPRHLDDRLLDYMEIRTRDDGSESHVVVNLQSSKLERYRSDAVTAILDLLESRYQLWEIAILHRTKTGAAAMLERAVLEMASVHRRFSEFEFIQMKDDDDSDQGTILKQLRERLEKLLLVAILEATDDGVFDALWNAKWIPRRERISDKDPAQLGAVEPEVRIEEANNILWCLRHRMLYKEIAHVEYGPYAEEVASRLASSKGDAAATINAALGRLASLRLLERDFNLPYASLSMYCLSYELGQKLAKVRVLYNNDVRPLSKVDSSGQVSGGHLEAQANRFRRLWRASLFASPEATDRLEEYELTGALRAAFRIGVLGVPSKELSMYDIAKMVESRIPDASNDNRPTQAYANPMLPYAIGRQAEEQHRRAAEASPLLYTYPSGQRTITSFFVE